MANRIHAVEATAPEVQAAEIAKTHGRALGLFRRISSMPLMNSKTVSSPGVIVRPSYFQSCVTAIEDSRASGCRFAIDKRRVYGAFSSRAGSYMGKGASA